MTGKGKNSGRVRSNPKPDSVKAESASQEFIDECLKDTGGWFIGRTFTIDDFRRDEEKEEKEKKE